METGGGILARLGEKTLGWILLAVIVLLAGGVVMMDPQTRSAILAGIWHTLVWIVITAALPWSGRLFMTRILAVGSNWAGLAVMAAFTLINLIVGLVLLGGLPGGGWGWLAALAALAVAGTYNYLVSEYLAEQAGG